MSEIELTAGQQAALGGMMTAGLDWEVAALAGPAGSGKTFVVGLFLEMMRERGLKIAVAAPTWKALSVVDRVPGVEYLTVHSLLGLRLKQLPDGSQQCEPEGTCRLGEFDLVVVDESSMIAPDLYGMLVDPGRREGCAVLFVGDAAQLAPVEEDSGLSPVFDNVQMQWRLTEVVRQARGNPIIEASIGVREAIEEGCRVTIDDLAAGLAGPNGDGGRVAGVIAGGIYAVVREAVAAIERGEDVRVLCFRNDQVIYFNLAIHRGIYGVDAEPFMPGERVVMQDSWDTAKGKGSRTLRNSEELTVEDMSMDGDDTISIKLEGLTPWVPIPADRAKHEAEVGALFGEWRRRKFSKDKELRASAGEYSGRAWQLRNSVANIRHAYASTLHKSQGSTFDTVLIDWADAMRMQSDSNFSRAIYVGITRTREKLAVVV